MVEDGNRINIGYDNKRGLQMALRTQAKNASRVS
jgi:hypothetical protein